MRGGSDSRGRKRIGIVDFWKMVGAKCRIILRWWNLWAEWPFTDALDPYGCLPPRAQILRR